MKIIMIPSKTEKIWADITKDGETIKASDIWKLRSFDQLIRKFFRDYWILDDGVTIYGHSNTESHSGLIPEHYNPIAIKAYNYDSLVSKYFASTIHWRGINEFYNWSMVLGNNRMLYKDYGDFRYFTIPNCKDNSSSIKSYPKSARYYTKIPEKPDIHPMFNYLIEVAETTSDALGDFSLVSPSDVITRGRIDLIYNAQYSNYVRRDFLELGKSKGFNVVHMSTDVHPYEWCGDRSVLRPDNRGKYCYSAFIIHRDNLKIVLLYRFRDAVWHMCRQWDDFNPYQRYNAYTIDRPGVINSVGVLHKEMYKYNNPADGDYSPVLYYNEVCSKHR